MIGSVKGGVYTTVKRAKDGSFPVRQLLQVMHWNRVKARK